MEGVWGARFGEDAFGWVGLGGERTLTPGEAIALGGVGWML